MFDTQSWNQALSGPEEAFRLICPPGSDPVLYPLRHPRSITPDLLFGRDRQLESLRINLSGFLKNRPPLSSILYGHRGTGKTSLVIALWNEWNSQHPSRSLRLIQVDKHGIDYLTPLIDTLSASSALYLILLDDLSFSTEDDSFRQMKGFLDGGIMASPENVALVVTSNIRHLVAESRQEMDDALHPNERRDDALALADRFGLSLFFDEPSFEDYCHLVLSKAVASGLLKTMPKDWLHRWSAWQEESREAVREPPSQDLKILLKAQRFSRDRASRSGRTAQQFVDLLARQIL